MFTSSHLPSYRLHNCLNAPPMILNSLTSVGTNFVTRELTDKLTQFRRVAGPGYGRQRVIYRLAEITNQKTMA